MPIFKFNVDQKQSHWERFTYIIEADTYEEAVIEARKIYEDLPEDYVEADNIEPLDTYEDLTPEDNNLAATRELFFVNNEGKDTFIMDNTPSFKQSPHLGD